MRCDLILAGVGGQGILSIATILDRVALRLGLAVKQAEVHGMAQRGGAVQSHLRISDREIASDLIPHGSADLILSVEPMEAVRYLDWLRPDGAVVSSASPFVNIPDYPNIEEVLSAIRKVRRHVLLDTRALAKQAGNARAENTVMLGAASPFLPFPPETIRAEILAAFAGKGGAVVEANGRAFDLGAAQAESQGC
ncbi:MAG: indolepyruvate oxidoreductase subunit beta [Planctomycetes bacterium]|jgi:indolepyruvate ferredoxin oxidoreductase beta subunit|nr:indolepyruvate oxidoreductase subunit beta [Planctomycetota bacterium]